ncbi:MAG TPA: carbohydrate-binding family 9-like protein [Verrucomicrobiae bacterium]|nr:carbohydrate-binding family 9-like protein [Verrucomicrobiae bacterium]
MPAESIKKQVTAAIADYVVRHAETVPGMEPSWNDRAWEAASILEAGHFRPESSGHRPQTRARLLYDAAGLHGIYHVRDQYVRCLGTQYFDPVWKDSCVEFFAEPQGAPGYFNFEFNCGGAFLCSYILDSRRAPGGFRDFKKMPAEIGKKIQARSSLPARVDPEIAEPVEWTLRFFIPFGVIEHFAGPLGTISGQIWRANFYKCGDDTSHPHWASWAPVDELNFHLPRCFGALRFE